MQNKRNLIWLEVAAAVCLFFTSMILGNMSNLEEVPSEEDIKTPLTAQQAIDTAKTFISEQFGQNPAQWEGSSVLQAHTNLSAYLNKYKLASDYQDQYGEKYPISYYEVEWKDPARANQATYILVHYTEESILGWNQVGYPEDTPAMSDTERLDRAASALQTQGYDPQDFQSTALEDGLIRFTSMAQSLEDARLTIEVELLGGNVSAFHAYFAPPQSFTDWFQNEMSQRDQLSIISLLLSLFMTIAAIVTVILYRKTASFSRGILLSIAVLALLLFESFNSLPMLEALYPEQPDRDAEALFLAVVNGVIYAILAISLYLSLVAGDSMFRTLGKSYWPRWRDAGYRGHVLSAMGRGYLYAMIILGVQQIIFFIAEKQFHIWTFDDPQFYSENYYYPLLFPLGAWVAAIMEEGTYRLFGISLFQKLFRFRWIAIIFTNFIWALGHISYPFFPPYTRLVEVFIIGFVFTFIFLRYGFICAVFAHAALDCFLMGLSLTFIGGDANGWMAFFYILSPALIAFLIVLLHRIIKGRQEDATTDWTRPARL
ncbi:CPBP family intramembrane glutamic endopeptidase [Marinicrinis sediminis]|uniref:CPBP family intramembrane glutamic endopeptidase n=1 Tax=Marinicrinis sediminis TaxID=1652465 RepID=A0ABW5R6H7_9BACL